ncbi:MAG: glycosyltransferase [Burkholderiales bacterium]|nr:glycosyltransferase [Burkholderiales bacterium]
MGGRLQRGGVRALGGACAAGQGRARLPRARSRALSAAACGPVRRATRAIRRIRCGCSRSPGWSRKRAPTCFFEALARLPRDLHWRLEHIGGGPLAARLARRARRLGIADRIDWRGPRTQPEVLAAYRAADLFVLASRIAPGGDRDGLPNVLLEAASQGLACVATRLAGIPELLEDGVSGVLVPAEAPAALADALASLMRDPLRRARLGAAARRRVETRFALAPNLERLAARFGLAAAPSEAGVCASRSMRR